MKLSDIRTGMSVKIKRVNKGNPSTMHSMIGQVVTVDAVVEHHNGVQIQGYIFEMNEIGPVEIPKSKRETYKFDPELLDI